MKENALRAKTYLKRSCFHLKNEVDTTHVKHFTKFDNLKSGSFIADTLEYLRWGDISK